MRHQNELVVSDALHKHRKTRKPVWVQGLFDDWNGEWGDTMSQSWRKEKVSYL